MVDIQWTVVRHSVEDIIRLLESAPFKHDMVPEINAFQVMNRAAMAHLSIERALKFLITESGGVYKKDHDLKEKYDELLRLDPGSAKFLEKAFKAAVQHYHYNPNVRDVKHLNSIERYLEEAGSDHVFEDIRYWELTQLTNEVVLRRIYLTIHTELLHALSQILLDLDLPKETVADRVEQAVAEAMWPIEKLVYGPGTPEERSVNSYIEWRRGFNTWGEALGDAVRKRFLVGDDLMADITRNAYSKVLNASDLAVSYFASTLDVLPKQPRGLIPCVEWANPDEQRIGAVKTPAGTLLGLIERSHDKLWHITPLLGINGVSSKARTQTDALSYLVGLLTRLAVVSVAGETCSKRLVGEGYNFFIVNHDGIIRQGESTDDNESWTHKLAFWDADHSIEINQMIRVIVPNNRIEGMVDLFEGTVTRVDGHEVYLSGAHVIDKE